MTQKLLVRFWLDEARPALCIRNKVTGEIKTLVDKKEIVWFLNAHNMTIYDLNGEMEGYDVLYLFDKKKLRPTLIEPHE